MTRCHFVPPYLLQRLAEVSDDDQLSRASGGTLEIDGLLRARREAAGRPASAGGAEQRTIYTADHTQDLPGTKVRGEGDPATGDPPVDEAYNGVGAVWALFHDVFSRNSVDDHGYPVDATVHYGQDYDNAFWDGRQLVFGDGDGKVFARFTKPVDVLAHEFTHGVTQFTAALTYHDQPGALNESVSDAFAMMTKQRLLGQTAQEADWLVGEGIFLPGVHGTALRSLKAPGTAYDDPRIGRDPQVASMSDYVHTSDDSGGVHTNSGIPNHAFYLVATGIGGPSWEKPGAIWYSALTASGLSPDADFSAFADATLAAAERLYGDGSPEALQVRNAWQQVEVPVGATTSPAPGGEAGTGPPPGDRTIVVRRTGGFTGMARSGQLDLDSAEQAERADALLQRLDFSAVPQRAPEPDRFLYTVQVGDQRVQVAEQDLTPELAELVGLVLGEA